MIAFSRSPHAFLKRKGLEATSRPSSRFAPEALLVHQYPIGSTPLKSCLAEGSPAPDRAVIKDINPPSED